MSFNPEANSSEEAKRFRDTCLQDIRSNLGKEPSVYELELNCFFRSKFGTDLRYEFCLNCCQMQWDWLYIERYGIENYWFKRIIKACCKYKKVILMGAASAGKTIGASCYCYTKWKSDPKNSSVYLSTTGIEAGEARTWGAIKDLHTKDGSPKCGTRLEYRHMIVVEEDANTKERDYRDSISCIAIKPGSEGKNVVGTVCGRKNWNVIWCCDELPHMDPGVRQARLNLASNPFHQFIGIGNKPSEGDPLYLDAEPDTDIYPDGWQTPGLIERWFWKVKGGICLYFDGEKSPNLEAPPGKPVPFPRLTTRTFIEDVEEQAGGRDSPGYWHQVRGFPAAGDIQDTVLTPQLLEAHRAIEPPNWMGDALTCVAGLDLGFRADGDPCVADFGKLGRSVDGQTILAHEAETVILRPKMSSGMPFEDQIAHAFIDQAVERDCHYVCVDISGDGGIMSQALVRIAAERNYRLAVVPVSFSGSPDDNVWFNVGGKRKLAKELFDRKVSQLWYSYRLSVQYGVIRGSNKHSRAVKQLCQRKVIMDEKKRWSVEPKKEMKKRIKRSPDDGDARCLCHEAARKNGLSQEKLTESVDERLEQARKAQQAVPRKAYGYGHSGARQYAGR